MTSVCSFVLASSNAVRPAYRRGSGGGAEVKAADGAAGTASGASGGRGVEGAGRQRLSGRRSPCVHLVCGLKAGALGGEELDDVELAVASRPYEGRLAILRRRGATRGERWRRGAGQQGRRAARAEGERRRGLGGGGWRGGADVVCGLELNPLLHEALEGGEVALLRRLEKSLLLRLRAQPSALSASQEPGWGPRLGAGAKVGARGRRRWRWRSMHTAAALARALARAVACGRCTCESWGVFLPRPEPASTRWPMPKP